MSRHPRLARSGPGPASTRDASRCRGPRVPSAGGHGMSRDRPACSGCGLRGGDGRGPRVRVPADAGRCCGPRVPSAGRRGMSRHRPACSGRGPRVPDGAAGGGSIPADASRRDPYAHSPGERDTSRHHTARACRTLGAGLSWRVGTFARRSSVPGRRHEVAFAGGRTVSTPGVAVTEFTRGEADRGPTAPISLEGDNV